jgi:hypothetical protein
VNNPGGGSVGPGRIRVANPAMPGIATSATPLADYSYDCRFGSDGKTIVYLSANGRQPEDVWVVDATAPNVVTRLREPPED